MSGRLVGAIGLVSSIVGIVSWFGITPETAGNAVYGVVRATFPFWMMACGFAIGWFARGATGNKREKSGGDASDAYARMMEGFSRDKACAALDAYEASGLIDVGERRMEVIGSIQANQNVFVMEALEWQGRKITGTKYGITDSFRAFLSRDGNAEKLERAANGK